MGSNQESIGDIQGQTPSWQNTLSDGLAMEETHHNEQDETVDRDRHE